MNWLGSLVWSTDTCPFRIILLHLWSVLYILHVFRVRGHLMDNIVHVLDIQGEDSDRAVTCFVV